MRNDVKNRPLVLCTAAFIVLLGSMARVTAQAPATEVRALWVQRTSLTSPGAIVAMVESARMNGFNTLLVQVRGRGDAYFNSRLEPRASTLSGQPPSFDPLEAVLTEARSAGLRVHAWVNVNLIAGVGELPPSRTHLVYAHPEWLMVPRELAVEMAGIDHRSPEYLGRLTRHARAHAQQIEGLYSSPLQIASVNHTVAVISDLAGRYALDGIHLDYFRFPSEDFDYSPQALAQFQADLLPHLSADERRQYAARAKGRPLFYTEMFPQRWADFRRSRLTVLLMRIRTAVKNRRPDMTVSAAVVPDPAAASARNLQDWQAWIENGLLDVLCPMAYTADPAIFMAQIAGARELAGLRPVWAGIGAYRLSLSETVENIRTARRLGAQGVILFSYDNLSALSSGTGYVNFLSDVARAAF